MAKREIKINKFSGGISDDIRQPSDSSYSLSQHFDINTSPYRLIPYRDSEADNTTQIGVGNFAWNGTTLYGLGLKTSTLRAQIYQKTGATGTWSEPSTSTSGTISHIIYNTFSIYRGYTYQFISSGSLDRWQIGGTYTDAYQALAFNGFSDGSGNVTQGLVHSKNDTLYIGYYSTSNGSRLFSLFDTTATTNAYQLPRGLICTALAEYGSYLAILCRPALTATGTSSTGSTNSKIVIWDLVSSSPTDIIDLGDGDAWCMANVGGVLLVAMNDATSSDITFTKKRIHIKAYAGGAVQLLKTLEDDGLELFGLSGYKPFISNVNGMSFGVYSTGSKTPTGIYTVSRPNSNYPFSVTMERLIHNSTSITSFVNLFRLGNVLFTSYNHVADTSSNVGRTNDTASYTATSAIETQRFGSENTRVKKSLLGVSVTFDPLPSGASVVLKYKKDEESSYTTIFTYSTQNGLYHSSTIIEASGVKLPDFREIQFRIESTGGAVITGFYGRVEDKNDDIYE